MKLWILMSWRIQAAWVCSWCYQICPGLILCFRPPAADAGSTCSPLTQSWDLGVFSHLALKNWNEASAGDRV